MASAQPHSAAEPREEDWEDKEGQEEGVMEEEDTGPSDGGGGNNVATADLDQRRGGSTPATSHKPLAVWNIYQRLNTIRDGVPIFSALRLPRNLVPTWFPGSALPLPITVQIVINGKPLGPRFHSRISPGNTITAGLTRNKHQYTNCHVHALRLVSTSSTKPPALELLMASNSPTDGGAAGGAQAAPVADGGSQHSGAAGDPEAAEAAAEEEEGEGSGHNEDWISESEGEKEGSDDLIGGSGQQGGGAAAQQGGEVAGGEGGRQRRRGRTLRGPPIPYGRPLEPEDSAPGVWPVNQTFTASDCRERRLRISRRFWVDSAPATTMRVQVVLDGAPAGGPLAAEVRALPSQPLEYRIHTSQTLPMAVGTAILRYRRGGSDLLEVHARSEEQKQQQMQQQEGQQGLAGGGRRSGAAGGSSRKRRRPADLQPLQPPQLQPEAGDSPAAPQTPAGRVPASKASAMPAAVHSAPLSPMQQQASTATQAPPVAAAAAAATAAAVLAAAEASAATGPQHAAPAAGGPQSVSAAGSAAGADESGAVTAALQALQLADINVPPLQGDEGAGGSAAGAALEAAVFGAYREVERAATALGLSFAAVDAVCRYVNAATEQPTAARRFLRMEYSRLVRAAAAGEVGVVRHWMERAISAAAD